MPRSLESRSERADLATSLHLLLCLSRALVSRPGHFQELGTCPTGCGKTSLVQDEQDVGGTASVASRAYAGTSQFTRSAASVSSLPQFLSAAAEQSQTQGLVQWKALARRPAGVRAQPHLSGSLAPESSS